MSIDYGPPIRNVWTFDSDKTFYPSKIRNVILKILKKKKERYKEKNIKLKELLNFDEIFICNSIFGIWPVKQILNKKFLIGKKTKELINHLKYIKKN